MRKWIAVVAFLSLITIPAISEQKQVLEQDLTVYVDPSGSDNNPGTENEPFQTIQKGVYYITSFDTSIYQAKVKLADGSYNEQVILGYYSGQWPVTLEGNPANPGNVHIYQSDKPTIQGYYDRYWCLNGVKLSNSGGYPSIQADHATIQLRNILFGDCPGAPMIYVVDRGWVYFLDDIDVDGDANQFIYVDNQSYVNTGSVTVTFLNTPTFAIDTVRVIGAQMDCENTTFTGSVIGRRFWIDFHGKVYTNNQGQNWIPGSIAGGIGSMYATYY